MGGKGSGGWHGGGRPKKVKPAEEPKRMPYSATPDAVTWLKFHPEDIPMARENLAARDRGYDSDGIRHVMAAMCFVACMDYQKHANRLKYYDDKKAEKELKECREFFHGDIFEFITNGVPPDKVEKILQRMEPGTLEHFWRKIMINGGSDKPLDLSMDDIAKNATAIIEE